MNTYGLLFGGLALAWGAVVAFLDQPAGPSSAERSGAEGRRVCTVLLIVCAVVTSVGIITAATSD
ncbi:hypothetical protein [Actinoplanes sp. RD1]|uniref:hypothetical protein n=1 Tax=Actinoplanes sp. RD1 TaxID=3064538 RepID=UPI002740B87E|nr:hypothetical protein [Actinoplanes sp. RD1]